MGHGFQFSKCNKNLEGQTDQNLIFPAGFHGNLRIINHHKPPSIAALAIPGAEGLLVQLRRQ
jgi:hypothetical protein